MNQFRRLRSSLFLLPAAVACGPTGGDAPPFIDGTQADPTIAGGKAQTATAMVFDARTEPAGANCKAGGVALLSGPDKNRNGTLDPNEVSTKKYVCNGLDGLKGATGLPGMTGAPGKDGPAGKDGAAGKDGLNSLILSANEPIGTACPTGGKKYTFGLDANRDGVLGDTEVSDTNYICSGRAGADGAPGKQSVVSLIPQAAGGQHCATGGQGIYTGIDTSGDGLLQPTEVTATAFVCNGKDGSSTTSGQNGKSALVDQEREGPGLDCEFGGTKISTGLDQDGNGTLDAAEATKTSYVCDGAVGPKGDPGPAGPAGPALLSKATPEAAGANCAAGGVQLDLGTDDDADGVLDAAEVDTTSHVCNGESGSGSGATGGVHSTVQVTTYETQVIVWVDIDGNGTHSTGEVVASRTLPNLQKLGAACTVPGTTYRGVITEFGPDLDNDGTLNVLVAEECRPGYAKIAAGKGHSCAIRTDGAAFCWGGDKESERTPWRVMDVFGASAISSGGEATCALLTDGTSRCWGGGHFRAGPTDWVAELGAQGAVTSVSAGFIHYCAATTTGAFCMGDNSFGQLGLGGTGIPRNSGPVARLTDVSLVSAGGRHSCALSSTGRVDCWGSNDQGQLGAGIGFGAVVLAPVSVQQFFPRVLAVTAGDSHSCFLNTNGTAECWGDNRLGQLGIAVGERSAVPVLVGGDVIEDGLAGIAAITAGGKHTCARMNDGTARCWGANSLGQLGGWNREGTIPYLVDLVPNPPEPIVLTGVTDLSAGPNHTCAVRDDTTAVCWGNNIYGELGNGYATDVPTGIAQLVLMP